MSTTEPTSGAAMPSVDVSTSAPKPQSSLSASLARVCAFLAWLLPPALLILGNVVDKIIGAPAATGGGVITRWPGWGIVVMPAAFMLACGCIVVSCICVWLARRELGRMTALMLIVLNSAWLSIVASLALIIV